MKKQISHIVFLVLIICVFLQSCNTNEFIEIIPSAQKEPIDLRKIESSMITSSFANTTRQTMRFKTTESNNNQGDLYFYSSHDLTSSDAAISNLVISVHGLGAFDNQVKSEYNAINSAIASSAEPSATIVIAPHFFHEGTGLEITWENATWRAGGKAVRPTGVQLSSSQIIDYLLEQYFLDNANFPSLKTIIISGHSAGGQFSQRYACISKVETAYPTYKFSYITSNPSHYLYINSNRWNGNGIYTPTNCDTYDDYPYGLSNITQDERYSFISKIGLETIRGNYINRNVFYVLGELDTSGATRDCESQSQQGGNGDSRYDRGQYLQQFMDDQYASNNHEVISVPGIGHNASSIYNSSEFILLINQTTD